MRVTQWFSGAGLLILALVVLFSTFLTDWLFKGVRFDLTEGGMYTLSDGTRDIVRNLPEPVDLYFYFSQEATKDAQGWRAYAKQVRELLEEFSLASKGNLKLHIVDPEPFSEDEDRAAASGLQAIDAGNSGDKLFFGLVAKMKPETADTSTKEEADPDNGRTEVIPVFQPDRQEFLEYDIAKLIYQVSQKTKPKIALLSNLNVNGGFDFMTRDQTPPWAVFKQLEQLFDVHKLAGDEQELNPQEYQLLLVIHPKTVSAAMQFAIDQYVLKGGHAVIFVDPFAEQDRAVGAPGMGSPGQASDLHALFQAWGVNYDKSKFIGDAQLALQVNVGQGRPPVRHLGILQLSDQNMPKDDLIVGKLETVHFSTSGYLEPVEGAKTHIEPLISSSQYAMPLDVSRLEGMQDPIELTIGFKPSGERYMLAARVTGEVSSAFPDGAPKQVAEAKDESSPDTQHPEVAPEAGKTSTEYLKVSAEPINVVIVADTDVLTDRLWVQVHQFFGQQVMQPFADNGDFLYNTVDVLSGSSELINIRSRGRFFRPFTVVKDMQREAETRFREVQETLTAKLQDIEGKLAQLQQQQGEDGNVVTLTPEMQNDLVRFQQEKLKIRKQLRDVQHQLNKDIDQLDFELKLINIAGVPLLLTLLVIVIGLYRRKQARS